MEQVKGTETFLEEKLLYGQLMSKHVKVKNSLNTRILVQDHVLTELCILTTHRLDILNQRPRGSA
ncbi:hypothetical protein PAMP_016168 [Pampus punctatissimus]